MNSESSQSGLMVIAGHRRRAQDCLNYVRREALQDKILAAHEVYDLLRDLRVVLLNTRERSKAFFKADKKLSGTFSSLTDAASWVNECE